MNGLNKNPGATAVVPRVGLYRHSYGPIGDWFFDSFLKNRMMTGGTRPPIDLSPTAIANNPDKYSVIESLYRTGLSQPVSNPFF